LPVRGTSWRWWVCCLLLLATMINYMDRLTLNLLARHINDDLGLNKLDYGNIESGFALAFASGAILFGFLVDRWNVFWIYPLALIAWSACGFFSGFATGFWTLLACRVLLGAAEAANWPCALRTTQRILPPSDRAMGNSILQSGAAVGAIIIPLVLLLLFDEQRPQTWRIPFLVVGAFGVLWVFLWWSSVRPGDLALEHRLTEAGEVKPAGPGLSRGLFLRRFAVLVVLVVSINMTWHFLRAWGPLYLQEIHDFNQQQTNWFSSAYYIFTDAGALTAGFVTLRLARGRLSVHASRRLVFLCCALLALLCALVPFLPGGALLVGVMLLIGFGALGVFPNYYSFSQDLTVRHQGKLTGTLGCCCWLAMACWQKVISLLVHHTGSYTVAFVISGLAPLIGFFVLLLVWGRTDEGVPLAAVPVPARLEDETRLEAGTSAIQAESPRGIVEAKAEA
jgi:ACS family hexuronate transporter-like MFS transporter